MDGQLGNLDAHIRQLINTIDNLNTTLSRYILEHTDSISNAFAVFSGNIRDANIGITSNLNEFKKNIRELSKLEIDVQKLKDIEDIGESIFKFGKNAWQFEHIGSQMQEILKHLRHADGVVKQYLAEQYKKLQQEKLWYAAKENLDDLDKKTRERYIEELDKNWRDIKEFISKERRKKIGEEVSERKSHLALLTGWDWPMKVRGTGFGAQLAAFGLEKFSEILTGMFKTIGGVITKVSVLITAIEYIFERLDMVYRLQNQLVFAGTNWGMSYKKALSYFDDIRTVMGEIYNSSISNRIVFADLEKITRETIESAGQYLYLFNKGKNEAEGMKNSLSDLEKSFVININYLKVFGYTLEQAASRVIKFFYVFGQKGLEMPKMFEYLGRRLRMPLDAIERWGSLVLEAGRRWGVTVGEQMILATNKFFNNFKNIIGELGYHWQSFQEQIMDVFENIMRMPLEMKAAWAMYGFGVEGLKGMRGIGIGLMPAKAMGMFLEQTLKALQGQGEYSRLTAALLVRQLTGNEVLAENVFQNVEIANELAEFLKSIDYTHSDATNIQKSIDDFIKRTLGPYAASQTSALERILAVLNNMNFWIFKVARKLLGGG